MQLRWTHWCCALSAAAALHAGAFAVLAHAPEPAPGGDQPVSVNVALGTGVNPSMAASTPAETLEATEPAAELAAATAPPEATSVEPAQAVPANAPPLASETAIAETSETTPETVSDRRPMEEATAVHPVEMALVEPAKEAVPPRMAVPPRPVPRPRPVEFREPAHVATRTTPPLLAAVRQAVPELPVSRNDSPIEAIDSTTANAVTTRQAVAQQSSGGGGSAGSAAGVAGNVGSDNYMLLLQAWLEKHKRYPRRARLHRQEGTALLHFVMDRDGHVLDYRIERSSGYGLLDSEVVAMIERAKPLPKIPTDMGREQLELVVPVQFVLR